MILTSQKCKVTYFSLPVCFPALEKSRAQEVRTSNFLGMLLRSCAILVLSLLMAGLLVLASLPAVAQGKPDVGVNAKAPTTINETETARFQIIKFGGTANAPVDVTISVMGSALADGVPTTQTITVPGGAAVKGFDIETRNIDADSVITVSVVANSAYTIQSNRAQASITVLNSDDIPPTVTSVVRHNPETSPTNADSLTWRVIFSEAVGNVDATDGNVDATDFAVTGTTATITNVTEVSGNPLAWDVTASGGNISNLEGTVTLSFATDQNIADLSDNALANTTPVGQNDNSYVIDNTAPTVTYDNPPLPPLFVGTSITEIIPSTEDNDIASYRAPGLTHGLTIDPSTGVISGTPTSAYASIDNVRVTVTDAAGNMAETIVIFPVIHPEGADIIPPTVTYPDPPTRLIVGMSITPISPTTQDNDIERYFQDGLPFGLDIDAMTGEISGAPTTANDSPADVTVSVEDTSGNVAEVTLIFPAISPPDTTAPTVTYDPPPRLIVGMSITPIRPTTQDTDIVSYSATGLPFGLEIDPMTGEISGAPTTANASPTDVTVSVTDTSGITAEISLIFPAISPPDTTAPTVTIEDVPETARGTFTATITFSEPVNGFTLSDIDSDNATLSEFTSVSGSNADSVWTVKVTPTANGTLTLDIAAGVATDTDGNGNEAASQAMSVYVPLTVTLRLDAEQPSVDGQIVDRSILILEFDADIMLNTMNDPPNPEAFTVTVDGARIPVTMVEFGSLILTLDDELPEDAEEVTVIFTASAAGPSTAFPTASPLMTAGDNQQIVDFTVSVNVETEAEAAARRAGRPLEAYLPRFGRTVGEQAAAAVRNRISANRNAGFQGQIAGRSIGVRESSDARQADAHNRAVLLTLLEQGVDATSPSSTTSPSSWSLTSEEVLLGTSFAFMRDTDAGMSLGFWGQASQSGFDGRGVAGNIDGRVTGVQLGADWRQGAGLFGLMVSRSRGSGDVAGTATAAPGEMKSDLTALIPYGGVEVSSTLSLWGAAGLGRGDVTFTPTGGVSTRTDIDWSMLTGGARGALGNAAALGGASLDWIADALWTKTRSDALLGAPATSGDTTRVRAGVEASWAQVLDSGSIQTPRLSLGLRHDGGDAETGLGLEIGGGFDWRDASGGLSFGVEGRALALHDDGDYRDWGVGLNFSYDPHPDTQRGFSMVFTQGLGVSTSGDVTSLMTSSSFPTGFDSSDGESRWSVEASHGTSRGLGMVSSPYVRLSGGGTDQMRDLRLGYRVGPDASHASDMNLDVWAEPSTNASQPVEAGASLRWNW